MIGLFLGCALSSTDGVVPGAADPSTTPNSTAPDSDPPERVPNILVIISDDVGIESTACYEAQTDVVRAPQPTLEGLCAAGLTFTDVWSYPMCSPTRAALMTGRYGWRTGVGQALDDRTEPLSPDEISLPDVIGGDDTAYIGKWHLAGWQDYTHPTLMGWSHFTGTLPGVPPSYFVYEKVADEKPVWVENYATTEVVDDALSWLSSRESDPWVLVVGFNAAHNPRHIPPSDLHTNENLGEVVEAINPIPYFHAMIEAMDTEMARLVGGVDRDNTIIIYLGDNGTLTDHNQAVYPSGHGKSSLYQGGVHVPMVITGPGIPTGEVESMVHVVDLYATIAELVGAALPEIPLDSVSMVPYLHSPDAAPQRQLMLTEIFGSPVIPPGRAARTDRHKLIRYQTGQQELYDLVNDPFEQFDLLDGTLPTSARPDFALLSDYLDDINKKATP